MSAYSPEANNSPARSVPSRRKPSRMGMPLLATLPVAQRICMRFMFLVSTAHRHRRRTQSVMMP